MKQFRARFDLYKINTIDSKSWDIYAFIIDNTANYYANDVCINDIIYIDSTILGSTVIRYKVTFIDQNNTIGTQLHANIIWDMEGTPIEPLIGFDGVIGNSTDGIKIDVLPSSSINMLNDELIDNIRDYENEVIINSLAPINSPKFMGKPLVPIADLSADDLQIANTKWVNEKIKDDLTNINDGGEF